MFIRNMKNNMRDNAGAFAKDRVAQKGRRSLFKDTKRGARTIT